LRAKVGAGLDPEAFRAGVAAGKLGHVGLAESAAMLAAGLGWPADRVPETIEPVLDENGVVLGVRQTATVSDSGRERVRLELQMSVGAKEPYDRVVVDGDPPLDVRVEGGTHGDRATVGTVVSLALRAGSLGAGLVTSYR
jgi:4-hydroxy-tetrahydrodipicolinate reductase